MSTALTADAQAQRSAAPSPSIGSSRTVRSEASSSRQLPLRSVTPERFLDGFQLSPEKEAWDHRTTNVEAPVTESGSPRRKHRSGKSGGFLLDSAYTIAHGQNRQSVHHHGKGKSKDEPGSSSGLERARIANHKHKPSIGSSPLANAVTNVNRQALDEAQAVENATEAQNARPVESIQDASRNVVNRHGMLNLPSFDADPAQIVNMALNLSENRRRHFSTGYVAPVDPAGGRRIVSTGRLGPPLQPSPRQGDNTKYRNAFSRTSPRDPSPRLNRFLLGNNSPLSETQNGEYYENAPTMNFPTAAGPLIDPSDATLVRVEKARETMELGLQYRRLLQYLPKLPVPQSGRSGENNNPNNETLGRSYNPLQYIRNRKVRTRERHLFNSEADGWRDIDKVKNWIDEVADMRKDHVSRVDDKFPLPSFGEKSADPTSLQGTVSPPASIRQNNGTNSKPTRPRKDWNFDYWDLLADAHWLDQRDNKYLIEDRDGKKLYQKAKLQKEHERRQSKEIQRHQPRRSESIPRQIISAITPRTSTADGRRPGEERGRPRHQLHDSITSAHEYSSSTDRKSRWARKLKRSESFSSSEESAAGSLRDLSRSRVHPYSRARQESAVLDKQVMQLLAQENEEDIDWEMVKDFQKLEESKTPPQTSTRHPSTAEDPTDPGIKHITKKLPSPIKIPSKDTPKRGGDSLHKPQLSLEDDSTAPNSPELESLVPGIAINLSPPGIQRDSISRRLLPSISRSDSKERHRVSQTDFAVAKRPASNSRLEQIRREAVTDSDSPRSPADSLLSPKDAIDISKSLRRTHSDGKRPHENGHAKESISKLKQLAKVPGKIADRVVHPSRVGDLIRRKESVDSGRLTSPRSGHASEASDADEDAFGNRLDEPISRRATNTSDGGTLSRKTTSNETRYFNNNLPVFRSPFKKRDGDESGPIMRGDHISQQQSALRDRGRQDRFHRLKPPSLDMRSVSPSPDPPMQRSKSNESENTFDETRRGSDPSGRRDSRRDATAGLPIETGLKVPVTGLASLDSQLSSSKRSHSRSHNDWTISHRSVSPMNPETHIVTSIDVTRVRALLLSSGVKATAILAQARTIRSPEATLPLLRTLQSKLTSPLPKVPRYQEHVLAARLLVTQFDDHVLALRRAAQELSTTTVDKLHRDMRALDELISHTVSPAVRIASDEADALNAELNSKCTLDVKGLQGDISTLIRKRKRGFRYLRRIVWGAVEWAVLGVMWAIWLVAVGLRLVRGVVRVVGSGARWLLTI